MLLYARNSNVCTVPMKQRDPEGWLPYPKLISSCVLLISNSCYHGDDGNLHVQGAPRHRAATMVVVDVWPWLHAPSVSSSGSLLPFLLCTL
jgi:hypothetical protein